MDTFSLNTQNDISLITLANSVTFTFFHENNENKGVETLPTSNLAVH